jgi:hypothetical protein
MEQTDQQSQDKDKRQGIRKIERQETRGSRTKKDKR